MREEEYQDAMMLQMPRQDGVLRRKFHQEFYRELLRDWERRGVGGDLNKNSFSVKAKG